MLEGVISPKGNPGPASFYEEFVETIYKQMDEKHPVWVVSHAGHVVPDDPELSRKLPPYKGVVYNSLKRIKCILNLTIPCSGNESLFDLQGQINHKIAFIDEFVDDDCDLILAGHSIGCKMAMEVMRHFKRTPTRLRIRSYMLFPTIERMRESPNGRWTWIMVSSRSS